MKRLLRSLVAAGLVALASGPARADFGYGVTLVGNRLITVDTTTGAEALVGPLGAPLSPYGLASVGGNLYTFDSNQDVIRQIDPTSGNIRATIGIGLQPGSVLGQGGLAFQSGTVGFLTSAIDPTTFSQANDLYRFDLSTGTSVPVSQTAHTLESIAFGPGGVLYGLGKLDGNLDTVDPTNGALNLVGNVGVTLGSPVGAISFSGGTLFATLDDSLDSLSTSTGAATAVGPGFSPAVGFSSISGLAFPAGVPEPASLILVGLGVAGSCGVNLLRRVASRRPG